MATDIDIDIKNRDDALAGLICIRASEVKGDSVKRHASGVYFQDIPVDPETGLSAFDHKQADALGYFKVDLLSSSIYENVRDEAHLDALLAREVDWSLLEHRSIVSGDGGEDPGLFHIARYFGIVQSIRPKSIDDLAVILALIRGSKHHLVGRPRAEIDAQVWLPDHDGNYTFKRAHAIAYAHTIIVQLNMMCEAMEQLISNEIDAEDAPLLS